MPDMEKVIADLRKYINYPEPLSVIVKKAIELLKEQEPVKPKYDKDAPYVCEEFRCGVCDQFIRYKQPYCCNCGRRVKWDAAD